MHFFNLLTCVTISAYVCRNEHKEIASAKASLDFELKLLEYFKKFIEIFLSMNENLLFFEHHKENLFILQYILELIGVFKCLKMWIPLLKFLAFLNVMEVY